MHFKELSYSKITQKIFYLIESLKFYLKTHVNVLKRQSNSVWLAALLTTLVALQMAIICDALS